MNLIKQRIITIGINLRDFLSLFQPVKKPKKNGLRILIFNWRDTKHRWAGGAEIYIHELAKRWVKKGNSVTLFCGNDQLNLQNEIVDGVTIIRRGGFYTVYLWAVLYYLFKFRKNFDVIIDSENGIPFFTPLFSSIPVVLLIHHVHQEIFLEQMKFPLSYIGKFIEGKIMPKVYRNRAVIAVSESSKNEIVKAGMAKEKNVQIVNPGINLPKKLYKKTKFPSIIYLGRLKAYKNIDIALKSIKFIEKFVPMVKLRIVGEGDMYEKLLHLTISLKISRNVEFLGRVSEHEKVRLLSESWIAVQPSQIEGWGITVIEANACKTPVVASNTKGLRDSIVDGITGKLVTARDTQGFGIALTYLLKNKDVRLAMSQNAFAWSQKFDWEKSAASFYSTISNEAHGTRTLINLRKASYVVNRISSFFI